MVFASYQRMRAKGASWGGPSLRGSVPWFALKAMLSDHQMDVESESGGQVRHTYGHGNIRAFKV